MIDWDRCIDVNRRDLLPMVAGMLAMLGAGETILRHVWLAVLALLRPTEAALRRLIAIAAKDIVVKPRARHRMPAGGIPKGEEKRQRPPCFLLIDPRRYAGPPKVRMVPGFGPRVRFLDGLDPTPPAKVAVSAEETVDAAAIRRRVEALLAAANDIPGQAKRLARKLAAKEISVRAMRPGRPPGHVAGGKRPVDLLLRDCHEMALIALAEVEAPP